MAIADAEGNFVRFRSSDECRHLSRVGAFLRDMRRRNDRTFFDVFLKTANSKVVGLNSIVGAVHAETIRDRIQQDRREHQGEGVGQLVLNMSTYRFESVSKVVDYMYNAHTDLNVERIHEYLEVTAALGVTSLHTRLDLKLMQMAESHPEKRVEYLNLATDPRFKLSQPTQDRLVGLLAQNHDALSTAEVSRLSTNSIMSLVATSTVSFHEKVDLINLALLWLRSDEERLEQTAAPVLSKISIQHLTREELRAFIRHLRLQLVNAETRFSVHVYTDHGYRVIVSSDPKKFIVNSGVVVPAVDEPMLPSLDKAVSKRNEMTTIEVKANYGKFDLDDLDLQEIQSLPDFESRRPTPQNFFASKGGHSNSIVNFDVNGAVSTPQRARFSDEDEFATPIDHTPRQQFNSRHQQRHTSVGGGGANIRQFGASMSPPVSDFAEGPRRARFGSKNKSSECFDDYNAPKEYLRECKGGRTPNLGAPQPRLNSQRSASQLSVLCGGRSADGERNPLVTKTSSSSVSISTDDHRPRSSSAAGDPYRDTNRGAQFSRSEIEEIRRVPNVFAPTGPVDYNNNLIGRPAEGKPPNPALASVSKSSLAGGTPVRGAPVPSASDEASDRDSVRVVNKCVRSPGEVAEIKGYPSLVPLGTPSIRSKTPRKDANTAKEKKSPAPRTDGSNIRSTYLGIPASNNSQYAYEKKK